MYIYLWNKTQILIATMRYYCISAIIHNINILKVASSESQKTNISLLKRRISNNIYISYKRVERQKFSDAVKIHEHDQQIIYIYSINITAHSHSFSAY